MYILHYSLLFVNILIKYSFIVNALKKLTFIIIYNVLSMKRVKTVIFLLKS